MSKAMIIGIVVVAIVGVGLWLFMARDEALAPAPEVNNQRQDIEDNGAEDEVGAEGARIIYGDEGFEPATVRIQAGESVTWVNQSSVPMWVASNPHPSHTDLPELDSRDGVAPGGEYTFTFQDPGDWGYHDHFNSFREGTVTVE